MKVGGRTTHKIKKVKNWILVKFHCFFCCCLIYICWNKSLKVIVDAKQILIMIMTLKHGI